MLYECDDTNCNAGKEYCHNRAFQNLTARTKKGGRYRVGVEVVKTSDRGYGVRSNRCFEPNQIIMEYTGEIITQAECETRMTEKYKDNEVSCGESVALHAVQVLTSVSSVTISWRLIRT